MKRKRMVTPKPSSLSNGPSKAQPKTEYTSHEEAYQSPIQPVTQPTSNQDLALLQQVISKLPASKKWTQRQRDKWLQALTANVDLLIDVVDLNNELP